MIIYPSLDVRGGKIVRLREGDPNRQTVFSDSPLEMAKRWIEMGATWLHMVNLDGAFSETNDTNAILSEVAAFSTDKNVRVQFGGGLRTADDLARAMDAGAARVVLGTIALTNPDLVTNAIEQYGAERITVGLDARNGKIATHGWTSVSGVTPIQLGQAMAERGVIHALYTDVNRDGGLSGSNVDGTIALAQATGLKVIASGGVSTVDEIRTLAKSGVVAGAVIGMALYEGKLTLTDALSAAL